MFSGRVEGCVEVGFAVYMYSLFFSFFFSLHILLWYSCWLLVFLGWEGKR